MIYDIIMICIDLPSECSWSKELVEGFEMTGAWAPWPHNKPFLAAYMMDKDGIRVIQVYKYI